MAERKTLGEILPAAVAGRPVLAAFAHNQVLSLALPRLAEAVQEPLPLVRTDALGARVYRDTAVFLLAACAARLAPDLPFRVRHSLGAGLFCSWEGDVPALKAALAELVARDEPIRFEFLPYGEAVEAFARARRTDEVNLLAHRNPPLVATVRCGDFRALNQSVLATRSGVLDRWDVLPAAHGLLLNLPTLEEPDSLPDIARVLAEGGYRQVFSDYLARGRVTGVETVGDLNRAILENRFDDYVRVVETLQTRALAAIADRIAARVPAVRLVLLAGPSSAGKTTTATRLCVQLRANGLKPMLLSTDDYFVGDARNPVGPDGQPDWETVEAVDRVRLAADLNALFAGEPVHRRRFDFIRHDGYDAPETVTLPPDGVILLEGIHALNPVLTEGVDDALKFRVFLNAITQLVVDSCTRVSTTDTRLLRRLVRDFNFRALAPRETFRLWPKVEAGERKWIYPYQKLADAVFDSSLDYELAVLKPYALQLLNQVKPTDREFVEARRLSGLLHNVSLARPDAVPGDSILRESIGGSQLKY